MTSSINRILTSLASLLGLACVLPLPVPANELALGKDAKAEKVSVPIHELSKLNNITSEQLYKMRENAVNKAPKLLFDTYMPSDSIFGMCESHKPWWGIVGMEAYGPGMHATDGLAKESNYILNPFRLLSAEVSNQVQRGGRIELQVIWKPELLTESDRNDPKFPYIWDSGPVTYNPPKSSAEVTYDVTGFNDRLIQMKNRLRYVAPIKTFSIIGYNARDFGFHYVYMDPHKSTGIKPWNMVEAVELNQFLHCGGSCGYPGGCNNMSPYISALEENIITQLPARAYFKLWREPPATVGNPADFTFVINFK